jgi:hypothetical protein
MKGFSGVGVVEENPDSERMYYSQLFYRGCLSHQQRHEIHVIFIWNTEIHLNVMHSFCVIIFKLTISDHYMYALAAYKPAVSRG